MSGRYCIRCGQEHAEVGDSGLCPACSPESAGETSADPVATRLEEEPAAAMPTPTRLEPEVADAGEVKGASTRLEDAGVATRRAAPVAAVETAAKGWAPGDLLLDTYLVKELLGEGGMGTVHRVHHRGWGLDLAVKSPKPEARMDSFEEEAEKWVKLGLHPHIACCYYVRRVDQVPRVFAELVEGGSLGDWIAAGKLATVAEMLDVAIQFAWGLHFAHEQGLVHRDVKPANVLLTADGLLKVTDFGLALAHSGAADSSDGAMTPAYCSPEQADYRPLDLKTDMWSWAMSILAVFDGSESWPFGQLAANRLAQYLEDGPAADLPPMPAAVAELLQECFASDPEARPPDMAVLADRLVEIYQLETQAAYARQQPNAAELRADSLSNRAVSLLDLGRLEEAREAFSEALQLDPNHPESVFNHALFQWRSAQVSDVQAVATLRPAAVANPRAGLYLAALHRERGALEEAEEEIVNALNHPVLASEAEWWQLLGEVRRDQERHDEAEQAFRVARDKRPVDDDVEQDRPESGAPTQTSGPWHHSVARVAGGFRGLRGLATDAKGDLLAFGGKDPRAPLVWNLWTGKSAFGSPPSVEHEQGIAAVSLTPDGRLLASASWDETVRIWEMATGECLWVLEGHKHDVNDVAFVRNGPLALSASSDSTLRLWDTETGQCVQVLDNPQGVFLPDKRVPATVEAVAVSADGTRAVSGGLEKVLRLWDLHSGECLRVYSGHTSRVSSVALSKDGRHILSGSEDGTVRLWDLESARCLHLLNGHTHRVNTVALTPDGTVAVSGGHDQTVRLWDLSTGRCLRTLTGHDDAVRSLVLISDGDEVLSGDSGTLHRWFIAGCTRPWEAPYRICRQRSHGELDELKSRFHASMARADEAWSHGDAETAREALDAARAIPGFEREPSLLERNARLSGALPRAGLRDAWLAEEHGGEPDNPLFAHARPSLARLKSPDGRFELRGGKPIEADPTFELYEVHGGGLVAQYVGHESQVKAAAFSPDCSLVVSASYDKTLRVWKTGTGECLHVLRGHEHVVSCVAVTPDGQFALSGDIGHGMVRMTDEETPTLRLWSLISGECLKVLEGHEAAINVVTVTEDGLFALSGSDDESLRVWSLTTGEMIRVLAGHGQPVRSLGLSPDNRHAVCGAWNEMHILRLALGADEHRRHFLWELDWEYAPLARLELLDHLESAASAWRSGYAVAASRHLDQARALEGFERDPELLKQNAELAKRFARRALRDGWPVRVLSGHESWVNTVAISMDGRLGASGSGREGRRNDDRSVRCWALSEGRCTQVLRGHDAPVVRLELDDDQKRLKSWGDGDRAREWDLATGEGARLSEGYDRGEVLLRRAMALAWDQKTVVSWSAVHGDHYSNEVLLADKSTGTVLKTLGAHGNDITAIRAIDYGRLFLSASLDATLKVWDLATGSEVRTITGQKGGARDVVVTMDGRFAIVACGDGAIRIIDLGSGSGVLVFEGHEDAVTSVALSDNGRFLLSGSQDQTVRLWELDWEYEVRDEAAWDEQARPYLKLFLSILPTRRQGILKRRSVPVWSEANFRSLMDELARSGLGWIREDGVRRELEEMAGRW